MASGSIVKYYIYAQRVKNKNPTPIGAKKMIEYHFKLEKIIAQKNNELPKFRERWNIWIRLMQ